MICAAFFVLSTAVIQDPVRLRTELPNGSVVLAETLPKSKVVSVQLLAAAKGLAESPETHGHRHLLEHLAVRGRDRSLDRRLESEGMFLTAETFRDVIRIEIRCGPNQVEAACAALGEVLEPAPASADDIAAELRVMRQELVLETDARILASELWLGCFGTAGLDPVGSVASIAVATPEQLNLFAKRQFGAQNLVVSIVGPGEVDALTAAGKRLLASRQPTSDAVWARRAEGRPVRIETRRAEGEARGALVGSFSRAETAWALAAGLAIAAELGPAFVSYTPSMQPGLIIVGREGELSGFGTKIDALTASDEARLYPVGKELARRWVMGYLDSASGTAFLRGTLVAQALGARPESMLENIARMSAEDFAKGVTSFAVDRCGVVIGVGR